MSAGPVVGGIVTEHFGWRALPILIASISAFALAVAALWLTDDSRRNADRRHRQKNLIPFSPVSFALYAASLSLCMYGLMNFGQGASPRCIFGLGLFLFAAFVRHERQAEDPIIAMRLIRGNINFLLSNLAALFSYCAVFAISYLLSIFLQLSVGLSPERTGLILICQPIVQAAVSPFAGRLSDRVSPYRLASAGMAVCTAALISYMFVGQASPISHIVANLVLTGAGFGLFSSPNQNAIMSCVSPGDYSIASSFINTMRLIGQILSMAIITLVMDIKSGDTAIAEAGSHMIMDSMHVAFAVFTAMCLIGVFVSAKRKS
jgi:predicted MFS family arabinose efflux permease